MTAVRSSPVMVRVEAPGSSLACSSWRTMIPSISTVGVPRRMTTRITRILGSKNPAGSSARLSSESLLSAKLSWNPLACPAEVVACTLCRASVTGCGTGTAIVGPIISVSVKLPSAIGRSRDALGQRDPQPPPHRLRQLLRPHRTVGVRDPPELLGVAEVFRGDVVQSVAVHDGVLEQQHEPVRLRHEAPPQVDDRPARTGLELGGLDVRVAARRREHRSTSRD